jgi:hypothetical protein
LPAWAARLTLALVETLTGDRPPGQLVRWVSLDVMTDLHALLRNPAQSLRHQQAPGRDVRVRRSPVTLRSMRWTEPSDGVAEVAAVITGPPRPVVVALRLEGLDGRWLCVAAGSPDGWELGGRAALDEDEAA